MESPFTITVSSDSVPVQSGRGETTITVTNTSGRPLKARAEILPGKPEAASWFSITRGAERAFIPGAVEQFVVQVKVPAGTAEGEHTFRIRVADVADPNERVTIGPTVGFKVAGSPPPPPPSRMWIFIVIGVVLLLIVGGVVFWAVTREPTPVAGVEVPDVTNKTVAEARTILEGAGLVLGDIKRKVDFKPPDIILEQKPAPRETISKGDPVGVVATHESLVPVPPLTGRTEDQAKKLLAGLLDVEKVERSCRPGAGAANTIYESIPRTGDEVSRRTKLVLRVKEDCVAVPGLVGTDKATAFTRLNAVGLLGNPVAGSINTSRVNIVEDQTPPPNELVAKGGTVTLRFFRNPTIFDRTIFIPELQRQQKLEVLRKSIP